MKHIHHILPKHMGGTNYSTNLIELSIEEHAEAHRILWETHGLIEDKIAWQCLSGRKLSEEDRILLAKSGFEKFIKNPSLREEWIEKIKSARGKQVITESHKKNISKGLKKAYEEGRFPDHVYDAERKDHMRNLYFKNDMSSKLTLARQSSHNWLSSVTSEESKSKKRKSMKTSKRIIVNGIEYDSLRHASKVSGISYSRLRKMVLLNSDKNIRLL